LYVTLVEQPLYIIASLAPNLFSIPFSDERSLAHSETIHLPNARKMDIQEDSNSGGRLCRSRGSCFAPD
jgi:hypothetical protein